MTVKAKMRKPLDKTGEALQKEKKIPVYIPNMEGSGEGQVECCINGYTFVIKRGENVKVPKSVARLLKNAGII